VSNVRASRHVVTLALMRKGEAWRVQIIAQNRFVRLFGRFYSEKSAREWIAAHAALRVPHIGRTIVYE
jgi:hypothetical protein